jgi:hypothetical protein
VLSQLCAGLNRDGAFLNDQPISRGTLCDYSSDSFDGRKIRIAVGQRRRSHANEDYVSPNNTFFRGSEMQSARFSNALDNVLEIGLKKWHDAILQFRELFDIAFTAEDVMPDLR